MALARCACAGRSRRCWRSHAAPLHPPRWRQGLPAHASQAACCLQQPAACTPWQACSVHAAVQARPHAPRPPALPGPPAGAHPTAGAAARCGTPGRGAAQRHGRPWRRAAAPVSSRTAAAGPAGGARWQWRWSSLQEGRACRCVGRATTSSRGCQGRPGQAPARRTGTGSRVEPPRYGRRAGPRACCSPRNPRHCGRVGCRRLRLQACCTHHQGL